MLEELTSRRSSTDIPAILDRLETGFDQDKDKQDAIDVLLATNLVSVGVDVQRLGLMVVAGVLITVKHLLTLKPLSTPAVEENVPA